MLAPRRTRTAHSRSPGLATTPDDIVLESIELQKTNRCEHNSNTKERKPISKRNHDHNLLKRECDTRPSALSTLFSRASDLKWTCLWAMVFSVRRQTSRRYSLGIEQYLCPLIQRESSKNVGDRVRILSKPPHALRENSPGFPGRIGRFRKLQGKRCGGTNIAIQRVQYFGICSLFLPTSISIVSAGGCDG